MNESSSEPQATDFNFGPYSLSITERVLRRAGDPIRLGSRAFEILATLAEHAGEVVTHKELMSKAWPHLAVCEANLRVQIVAIRKSLGDDGARYISSVAGRGYCFVAPVSRFAAASPGVTFNPSISEPVSRLPPRLTRMIGRDEVVRELVQQLEFRQFVSIVGPGALAKRQLHLLSHMR